MKNKCVSFTETVLEDNDPTQAKQLMVNRLRNLVGQLKDLCPVQKSTMLAAFKYLSWLMKQEIPHTTKYIPHNNLGKLFACSSLHIHLQLEDA
ncbi:hypothetical protein DPMN_066251 [Dreissena polymorpha]|uniref:Uncharacterized protein n=2 Tax=Dreissena polymorpha TaxID=45954 RepID=A0A9D4BKB4_DREPO|nr:hypothetical protein DPMN_066251 [Dreissena polymorpha]